MPEPVTDRPRHKAGLVATWVASLLFFAAAVWAGSCLEGFVLFSPAGAVAFLTGLVLGCGWLLVLCNAAIRRSSADRTRLIVPPAAVLLTAAMLCGGLPQRLRHAYDEPYLSAAARSLLEGKSTVDELRGATIGTQRVRFACVVDGRVEFHLRGPMLDWPVLLYAPAGRPTQRLPRQVGELVEQGGDWYLYWYKFLSPSNAGTEGFTAS